MFPPMFPLRCGAFVNLVRLQVFLMLFDCFYGGIACFVFLESSFLPKQTEVTNLLIEFE